MADQFNQQNQQGSQSGQQGGGGQNPEQQRLLARGAAYLANYMSPNQLSFYDPSLQKQLEGSFKSDGKSIHVFSAYGTKSAPYGDLGACIDLKAQILLARKLLSELARDPGSGKFKDLQQQKDDQQLEPMQKPQLAGGGGWFSGGSGTNP